MADAAARPGLEELLAQREWVRGLARSLAATAGDADDLEQETMAAALRSPPPSGGYPRAWLATVLRNLVRRAGRGETRRAAREQAAARTGAADDPADVVARAEAHRRLVEAVLRLGEPSRTAILLRFYDGLPPREVALATGVPVETARTRLKRALADLRAALGGDRARESLLPALLPLLGDPSRSAAAGPSTTWIAGGAAMGTAAKVGMAGAALALAAGGVAAWRSGSAAPAPLPIPPPIAAAPAPPARSPTPTAPPPAPPSSAPASPPPPAATTEDPAREAERVAALLREEIEEFSYEGGPLREALEEAARRVGLGAGFEGDGVRDHCESHRVNSFKFVKIQFADMIEFLLTLVPPPGPRPLGFEIRKDCLWIVLKDPSPPRKRKESEADALERKAAEERLLERLRSEKTSFAFDGQSLPATLQYLSQRHRINIMVEETSRERCEALKVRLSLSDVTLEFAIDELIRPDADLRRELYGTVVMVRAK